MFTCDICAKILQTKQSLGGHKLHHSFGGKCTKPEVPFEKLKKDGSRKERLLKERGWQCERCKLSEWCGEKIPLELDHIDGHPGHNSKENLRLLCPNCHSQMPTHAGKNVGKHSGTERQEKMSRYPDYRKEKLMHP
jgi:5-methylcytosine-specific restriction endonuclease McrA